MAVQYNSENDSWFTWIDKLKREIPKVSKEAEGFFDKMDKIGATITSDTLKPMLESTNGAFDYYIKNHKLVDESLISFLQNTKYATKDLANYQLYLKESSQSMTLFQHAGKAAGTAIKNLGATLASMGVAWLAGEALSLAIMGIDHLANAAKYEKQALEDATEAAKKYADQIKTTKEKMQNRQMIL